MYTTRSGPSAQTDAPIGLTDLGRVRVLRALAEHQRISRSEIVNRTGLARATVSSTVAELIDAGLVRESAAADAGGTRSGRPAQVLSLAPDCAYALGLDIAHDHVRAVLTDVVGTVLWDRTRPMAVDDDPKSALDTAVRLIGAALADVGVPREKVLGLGAGFACPVDKDRRRLHAEGIMPGWVGVQPVDELAGRTGLPVQIVNDANAGVLAERRFGAARGCDNVVYLRLSSGIGAGTICDGRMPWATTAPPGNSATSSSSRTARSAGAATAAAWRRSPARRRSPNCSPGAGAARSPPPTCPNCCGPRTAAPPAPSRTPARPSAGPSPPP